MGTIARSPGFAHLGLHLFLPLLSRIEQTNQFDYTISTANPYSHTILMIKTVTRITANSRVALFC